MRKLALLAVAALFISGPALAGIEKIKGLHDDHERPRPLIKAPVTTVDAPGEIFAVIGGDYGFVLFDAGGAELATFDDSQDAIGFAIKPGRYKVIPNIEGDVHHHQFIEVLIKTH
ncbi:MAG: hypothetical protein AAFY01_10050 [Pseudomonadota bacterium]